VDLSRRYYFGTVNKSGIMNRHAAPRRPLRTNLFKASALAWILLCLLACGNAGEGPERQAPAGPESFTFFDIGRNSRFSDSLRGELALKLGNDAVERRSIIDLENNYRGFLAAHLPELEALNLRLNHPPGERVDHEVIKLMYRYARQKNAPFDYVELVFDPRSRAPLVFRIRFKADETGLVEALRAKHGSPQAIPWDRENGQSLIWHKEGDVLMVSLVPDAFGGIDHHVAIYFTENLNRLAEFEQARKQQKSKEKTPADRIVS
jgi:hypothetical protein